MSKSEGTYDLADGFPSPVSGLGVYAREQRARLRGAAHGVLQRRDELERVQRHHAVVVVRRQHQRRRVLRASCTPQIKSSEHSE